MTYAEAIGYLQSLQMFGLRPGLETTVRLAAQCGHPQDRLQFIHVAGTNGKGSVCALLESMHRRAGRRVGLYTSPHLVSVRERIQINRQPISEADLARWVDVVRRPLNNPPSPSIANESATTPTFFEFVTVMALGYFAEQGCDLVLWETGLGGRLDATNIVTPRASVITNIDLDHQLWLGSTYAAIAAEKAGILKPGRPIITAAQPGRGLEVIAETSRRLGCALTVVGDRAPIKFEPEFAGATGPHTGKTEAAIQFVSVDEAWAWAAGASAGNWPSVALAGRHQQTNAALALATMKVLAQEWPVSTEAMRAGLEGTSWPGRMQRVPVAGGREILLDGAHNPAGALALREGLTDLWPGTPLTLILGVLADKDWEPMAQILGPMASRILVVPVSSGRTLSPALLMEACQRANPRATVTACTSLAAALARTRADEDAFVVVAGSLYLIGEAMETLGVLPIPPATERGLNEWGR